MEPAVLRDDMVDGLEHPTKAAVRSEGVGLAMRTVPRHEFVADDWAAHEDRQHREWGTTVLAPSTAARLIEALDLEPGQRTLIVGTGVGYTAAVAAEIVGGRHVHGVDLSHQVVRAARKNLSKSGYDEVLIAHGDGAEGLPAYAPYDRILLEASAHRPPRSLREQLAPDGRLVLPRMTGSQELVAIEEGEVVETFGAIALNPLLISGEQSGAIERNRTAREDREYADRASKRRNGWERDWIDWDGA